MSRVLCTLCMLSIILTSAVGVSADGSRHRARAGSFVRYSVYSVADLVERVSNDPAIAKRYANHFGVSKEALLDYFNQNLKVVTLTAPLKVTTYFVSKRGRILSKQRTLPAGRQVFMTAGNKPFLEIGCGNPVTKKMPEVKTEVKPAVETVGAPPVTEALAPPVVEEIQPEVMAALPIAPPVAPIIEAFNTAPSILEFAEVLAPLVAGLQYVQASKDTPPIIPEPSSLLSVALGSVGAACMFVRRRRARRS